MIGHHDPFMQEIPARMKATQGVRDEIRDVRPAQVTGTRAPVKIAFDFAVKIARNFFLGIVDGFAALGEIVQPSEAFGLFTFKAQQDFFGQRIGQAKRDEVGSPFAFDVRQVPARVNAGAKRMGGFIVCAAGAELMAGAFQAGIRFVRFAGLHGARLIDWAGAGNIRTPLSERRGSAGFQTGCVADFQVGRRAYADGTRVGKPAIQQTRRSAVRL